MIKIGIELLSPCEMVARNALGMVLNKDEQEGLQYDIWEKADGTMELVCLDLEDGTVHRLPTKEDIPSEVRDFLRGRTKDLYCEITPI